MKDEDYMLIGIEEAQKSKDVVGCGVVIVKNGQIIAKAHNTQRETHNASAHAEINAVGIAGAALGRKNLDGCVIYCTCEPCTMCLSAIVFSKISRLVYGTSIEETFPDNLPIKLTTEELLSRCDHRLEVEGGCMKEECSTLFRKQLRSIQ